MINHGQDESSTIETAQGAGRLSSRGVRWTVSQIGAREHYGLARSFEVLGTLRMLYTDFYAGRYGRFLKHGPRQLQAIAGRRSEDIPSERVQSFNLQKVRKDLAVRSAPAPTTYDKYVEIGEWYGKKVRESLRKSALIPERDGFISYNTGALEPLLALRETGVITIVDQVDPGPAEYLLVEEERRRWDGWERQAGPVSEHYVRRLRSEWAAASVVLVNSEWSRSALVSEGVPKAKIVVAPLCYDPPIRRLPLTISSERSDTLNVLWLGTVNLRKGIQYLLKAASILKGENIRFTVVGPIEVTDLALSSAPTNVEFLGRVHRTEAESHYLSSDLFVLPTLSDGFAITQLEAMSFGLPVVTTPNCGKVVSDGTDGIVVPTRDSDALSAAIYRLHKNRSELAQMSQAATKKANQFRIPTQAMVLEQRLAELGITVR